MRVDLEYKYKSDDGRLSFYLCEAMKVHRVKFEVWRWVGVRGTRQDAV